MIMLLVLLVPLGILICLFDLFRSIYEIRRTNKPEVRSKYYNRITYLLILLAFAALLMYAIVIPAIDVFTPGD